MKDEAGLSRYRTLVPRPQTPCGIDFAVRRDADPLTRLLRACRALNGADGLIPFESLRGGCDCNPENAATTRLDAPGIERRGC